MLILLPPLTFILVYLVLRRLATFRQPAAPTGRGDTPAISTDPRWAFLGSSVILGVFIVGVTEGLSLFRAIGFGPVTIAWAAFAGIAAVALLLLWKRMRHQGAAAAQFSLFRALSLFEIALLAAVAVLVLLVGVTAFVGPPNTWDSMTYHMSRVMHWIVNRSVAHYPTHILRQLHLTPFAEFAILHLQILSGGDSFANLIQWFSMLGSILGVSLLAKQLGARTRGQVLAAVFCATIPMGILQGSSTQNDYVVAFWLVCFANYLATMAQANGRCIWRWIISAGAALGLALLTKSTAYLFAAPILLWFVGRRLFSAENGKEWGKILGLLIAMGLIALATNAGHYGRNLQVFGSPLGPMREDASDKYEYANAVFGFRPLLSNTLRNLGLEMATPVAAINRGIETGIHGAHRLIGISENDPRTTWTGTRFGILNRPTSEDLASSPLHVILIIIAGIMALIGWRNPMMRQLLLYGSALVLGFLLFCFYLRWQPWHSRLLLPLLILSGAFVGSVWESIGFHKSVNVAMAVLIIAALIPALNNQSRPLIGERNIFSTPRFAQRFVSNTALLPPYVMAVRFLGEQGISRAGLITGQDAWEYPLWVLLKQVAKRPVELEHVQVENVSAKTAGSDLGKADLPSMTTIVVLKTPDQQDLAPKGEQWEEEFSAGSVSIYGRK